MMTSSCRTFDPATAAPAAATGPPCSATAITRPACISGLVNWAQARRDIDRAGIGLCGNLDRAGSVESGIVGRSHPTDGGAAQGIAGEAVAKRDGRVTAAAKLQRGNPRVSRAAVADGHASAAALSIDRPDELGGARI